MPFAVFPSLGPVMTAGSDSRAPCEPIVSDRRVPSKRISRVIPAIPLYTNHVRQRQPYGPPLLGRTVRHGPASVHHERVRAGALVGREVAVVVVGLPEPGVVLGGCVCRGRS